MHYEYLCKRNQRKRIYSLFQCLQSAQCQSLQKYADSLTFQTQWKCCNLHSFSVTKQECIWSMGIWVSVRHPTRKKKHNNNNIYINNSISFSSIMVSVVVYCWKNATLVRCYLNNRTRQFDKESKSKCSSDACAVYLLFEWTYTAPFFAISKEKERETEKENNFRSIAFYFFAHTLRLTQLFFYLYSVEIGTQNTLNTQKTLKRNDNSMAGFR